jgi:hypothetical protein
MNEFWTGAFLPLPFHCRSGLAWIGQRFTELFSDPTLLRYRWPLVFVLLALIGIAVTYLQQHRRPGDLIYIAQLQQVGTHFYGSRYGLQSNDWITGICDPNDARAYLRDVDRFRGVQRLWVLIGSGRPLQAVHASIRDYLETIGIRRDVKTFPSMTLGYVTIELYDLGDSARADSTNAEKFPVPAMPRDPKIGCREWTAPGFDWRLDK